MVSGGSTNGRYRAHLQQQLLQKPDTLCATWNLKMRTTMSRFSINFAYAMRATPNSRWYIFLFFGERRELIAGDGNVIARP
jgi:hypothetical protein